MIRTVYIWIFLIYFILKCNAVRRGGTSKSRVGKMNQFFRYLTSGQSIGAHSYSAGNTANEDPGRAILAIVFMILTCGGGIGWRIYRCTNRNKQRKSLPIPIPYPNNIYLNPLSSNENPFKV